MTTELERCLECGRASEVNSVGPDGISFECKTRFEKSWASFERMLNEIEEGF